MRIHAIQTGTVKIKTAQAEGRGLGFRRQLAIFTDSAWTEWLPNYAWAIEHWEGVIVVDTGQGAHLLETGKSCHPWVRWEVAFRIDREEEIGPQLRALGIGPRDVKRVVLTHLHMDRDGGFAHFSNNEILVASGELRTANRWDSRLDPAPLDPAAEAFGPFALSRPLTQAGDVVAVATPGHTADHIRALVQEHDTTHFLAWDASYNENLMLAGKVDGVNPCERVSGATLNEIRGFAQARPTVYLPTHDPESGARLANRCLVGRRVSTAPADGIWDSARRNLR
jgi:N-acyl homoserine lactone hydrolase